jgi:hypothetical protein
MMQQSTAAHDVFISYSSRDKSIAHAICAALEAQRVRCWIAPRDVVPGLPYAEQLLDAIDQSRVMVLVFSSRSNDSDHVMREVEEAVTRRLPIVPLRIEAVEPSRSLRYFLKAVHWLDALTPPVDQHLENLVGSIHVLLSRSGSGQVDASEEVVRQPSKPVGAPITGAYAGHGFVQASVRSGSAKARTPPSSPLPIEWNRFLFRFILLGVAWLVATMLWGVWTYWVFYLFGDRNRGTLPEDPTPKVWACVAGAALLVGLLAWIIWGIRHFRSHGVKRP